MILVIVIFGGAVYVLQSKVFAPQRVRKRRLRKGDCPHCELPLRFSKKHCPNCGMQIEKACESCGKLRYVDFSHCPHCANKK